jgi:hypothetical protein
MTLERQNKEKKAKIKYKNTEGRRDNGGRKGEE